MSFLGSLGNIRVDLLDEHPDLSQSVTGIQNASSLVDLLLLLESAKSYA